MLKILQGTTPKIVIAIDPSDLAVNDVTKLELAIQYDDTLIIKALEDVTVDTDENTITYALTEAETMAMTPAKNMRVQARFMLSGGDIVGTEVMPVRITNLMSEEMMS